MGWLMPPGRYSQVNHESVIQENKHIIRCVRGCEDEKKALEKQQ